MTDADEEDGFRDSLRADLNRCREIRLHLLASGVLATTVAAAAVAFLVMSSAVGAGADLASFVEVLSTNAAWLFTSVFALVGLFVAYPARGSDSTRSRQSVVGILVSRWLLVAVGILLGFAFLLVVGVFGFDSFSLPGFVVATLLTTAVACAYVSVGVSIAVFTGSDERLVLSLLTVYGVFVFLWDTALVPTLVAMAVVGDPSQVIGTPPGFYDALLAVSPGGAYSALSNAALGTGADGVWGVGTLSLIFWLLLPPAVAAFTVD